MENYLLEVDSGERDTSLYPNSNSYVVQLNRPLYNVSGIHLVSGRIPLTQYTVDAHNNTLYIDGTKITLSPNNFSNGDELAAGLTNDLPGGITPSFNAVENKIELSNVSPFSIEFKSKSPAGVLGFLPQFYAGTTITPPGTVDLDGPTSIILSLSTVNDDSISNDIFLDNKHSTKITGSITMKTATDTMMITIGPSTSNTLGSYYSIPVSNIAYTSGATPPFLGGDNVSFTISLKNTETPYSGHTYTFDDTADGPGIGAGEFRFNADKSVIFISFEDNMALTTPLQAMNNILYKKPLHYYGRIMTTGYTAVAASSAGAASLATVGGANVMVTNTSGGNGLGMTILDYNGPDDPVRHNFYRGSSPFMDSFRVQFYCNNFDELVPYDFKLRNHILKFEIKCSLDKLLVTSENKEVNKMVELPPKLELERFKDKYRPWGDKRMLIYTGAVVIFIILVLILSSFKYVRPRK